MNKVNFALLESHRKILDSPWTTHKIETEKIKQIIDIWKMDKGVVCLHVFHNIMPVVAFTIEAAIIDAIGLDNLTNLKRGDYYGSPNQWRMRDRKEMGAALLYKAFNIFLSEGESQLRPNDMYKF